MPQPVLSDIARELNLSVSTVSYALRGTGSVSTKTRERVRAVAERLGYRPDPMISAAAARRFSRVPGDHALVAFLQSKPGGEASMFFRQLARVSHAHGLKLTEHRVRDVDEELPILLRQLYQMGYSGLISGRTLPHGKLPDEVWSRFSVLRLAAYSDVSRFHRIVQSDPVNLRRLLSEARRRGYSRPGIVIQTENVSFSHDDLLRIGLAGFEGTPRGVFSTTKPGERRLPEALILSETAGSKMRKQTQEWLEKHEPDCVLGTHCGIFPTVAEFGYNGGVAAEILTGEEQYRQFSGFGPDLPTLHRETLQRMDSLIRHRENGVPRHSVALVVPSVWQDARTL